MAQNPLHLASIRLTFDRRSLFDVDVGPRWESRNSIVFRAVNKEGDNDWPDLNNESRMLFC